MEETDQLNHLIAGVFAFVILSAAAAAVWAWAYSAHRLRHGSPRAPALVFGTTLTTALLAVAGTGRIFPALLDARSPGILLPLLLVSPAALTATLWTWSRHRLSAGCGPSRPPPEGPSGGCAQAEDVRHGGPCRRDGAPGG
ncbi:hypothetical protein ACWC9T_34465 [Kitasatospora sp. NPDC001159]